nr:reverse transcriptase domain-containing protein [Tanacetum cinerariifolium]
MTYKEPPIPPTGVSQQEPVEVTTDTEPPNSDDIHPPTFQVEVQVDKPAEEPFVDDILAAKFMEIFRDLHFKLSFADVLIHMPKFAPMFKKLLNNKDKLIELTKTPLNENCSAVVLKKLPEKLGDLADFVVLDFVADPRVPLILGRAFLSTAHAIINVFEREIIIRQNQQSLTIQCSDIPSTEQINKIKFINEGGIDSESEEIEDFLNDDSIQFGVEDSPFNMIKTFFFSKDVAKSSTKNLIPIPNECIIVLENGRQSTEPINDNPSDFTIISNPLSDVESNSDESTSNTVKNDEFYEPFNPIHILEEERTRRKHADYINRMEMLFTINPHPHNPTNDNTNVESFSSFQIPNQESEPCQEEIDVVSQTNDVLPPSDDDSDDEVDVVADLRVDNVIQNSEHEYSESEDSDLDNPLLPLPPPEPPDKDFDFEKEILVVRYLIVKFECINARMKFDVFNAENDVFKFIMFSLLFAESEDTIFDP